MSGRNESNVLSENTSEKYELTSDYSRRIYKFLGRPIPGKITFLFILLLMVNAFVVGEIILALVFHWSDFSVRSKAIENLNLGVLVMFTLAEPALYPQKIDSLMKTIDGPIFKYNYILSEKQKALKKDVLIKDKSTRERFNLLLIYFFIVVHLLPCVYSAAKIVLTDINNCCEEAYYDMVFSTPLNNVFLYIIVLILQSIYSATISITYLSWILLVLSSLLYIGAEIEILCLFIKELDSRIQLLGKDNGTLDDNANIETINKNEEKELKLYLKEIVQYHKNIIRAVKDVNQNTSSTMFMYNQFCCIELCINLYLGFAITDARRYNYFSTLIIVMSLVVTIGHIGQKLSDKGEKLNQALYQCSWINKPKWFQKSIYFMTMCASKPLRIAPKGLYVLNLANTAKIGQAAYSYFNLLRSFKDKV